MKRTIKKSCSDWIGIWVQELLAILPILVEVLLLDIVPELTDAEAKRSYAGKQSGKKPISE
jgi:hypothetical protein